MHEPLLWNKLDEAAAWLTEATNEQWSVNHVLDAAFRNCETKEKELKEKEFYSTPVHILLLSKPRYAWITCLEAVMPWGTEFGHYESSTAEVTPDNPSELVRKFSGGGNNVELTQGDVKQLLLYGQVRVKTARYPHPNRNNCVLIEPVDKEHIVTLDMVGIGRNELKMLAKEFGMAEKNSYTNQKDDIAALKAENIDLKRKSGDLKKIVDSAGEIITGFAIKHYPKFNPLAKKNMALSDMMEDLETAGFKQDPKTLDQFLRAGAEKIRRKTPPES